MATSRVLRRFPLNLNIGTDLCHVVRIRQILNSTRATRFIERILNQDERRHHKVQPLLRKQTVPPPPAHDTAPLISRQESSPHKRAADQAADVACSIGPSVHDLQLAATFMAGRFAAKEAVIKAHPHKALTWHDITIRNQTSVHPDRQSAPIAIIRGELEDQEALISISHDGDYATAVCLATWN
ncbi:hypothetical protein M406DRAFT_321549 [Cryphonectria parasitica EP155]|uniref:4'-phosphopantetheinyl transferase domain-containing protein n=1 Tax=Cryphonectria parasitica (strain ATCC 38755 / EP155) TaxID=660469 RepID=A0A9P5CRQ9_CRYP1|nr:uncharacterized protein M406DRAFT_321549 [Cryphonectria parasitica EP155]KAF3767360.1 hypothetical protein M406DRAFT_321549 [Cryphonectria parasitica EP155]